MTTLVWLEGAVVPSAEARVPVLDHGFTVGDAVFETTVVVDGVPLALGRHLARLGRSAAGLGLAAPDEQGVRAAVAQLCRAHEGGGVKRLRITWTGGVAGLGSGRAEAGGTLVVVLGPQPVWPATTSAVTVAWTRNERAATAGLKTTSYAENVVGLAEASRRGASEALMANTRGELCEGTGTNVFVVVDGELLTPPLSSGCLPGITRELVIETTATREATLPFDVLDRADEIFLTSSTRHVHPVHRMDDRVLGAPGRLTRDCSAAYAALLAATSDP